MSPTIFRDGPFRFFFFSRDEERLHVHVQSPDGEAKFWIEPEIELARSYRLSDQDLKRVLQLVVDTSRRSEMPGTATSTAEVTNISPHGFWMLVDGRELFLAFDEFPWFKQASVEAILRLERPSPEHFYWPDVDVDLGLDSIERPQRYPLKSPL